MIANDVSKHLLALASEANPTHRERIQLLVEWNSYFNKLGMIEEAEQMKELNAILQIRVSIAGSSIASVESLFPPIKKEV